MIDIKCNCCKEIINREKEKWLKDKSSNYHYDCYVKKKQNTKRPKSDSEILEKSNMLLEETLKKYMAQKEKDSFYAYIQEVYEITMLPKYVFTKMNSIFNGEYMGLNKPINLTDIFTMFKLKKNVLDKIYAQNVSKGKTMDGIGRFNYDLAILLSQYDKYVKWKENSKTRKIKEIKREDIENRNSISKIIKRNSIDKKNEEDDIDNLIDEL